MKKNLYPEKILQYNVENREKKNEKARIWYENNKERHLENKRIYRKKIKNNEHFFMVWKETMTFKFD